jgi:GntR family transcriptional repressor for pyruvate dehydrogenase complex
MIQLERIGFSDVVGVFGALNAYAAELAAVHATEDEIAALRSALDRIENSTDANGIVVALTEFLEGLASAARNPLLAALCKFLAGLQIGLASELCGGSFDMWRDTSARLATERKQVVDAIADRDSQAACALARNYHQRALAVIAALPGAVAARLSDPTFSNVLRSLPSQPRSITPRS